MSRAPAHHRWWLAWLALLAAGCGQPAGGAVDKVSGTSNDASDVGASLDDIDASGTSDGASDAGAPAADGATSGTSDGTSDSTSDSTPDGTTDAAADGVDASAGDAAAPGPKTTPWGTISGACGAVTPELTSSAPSFLVATYALKDAAAFDPTGLDPGAKQRYEGPNAGGSSKCSEVMSMQLLVDCEGGGAILTEVQLVYTKPDTSITDFAIQIAGKQVGVSVTRAYLGPKVSSYTEADATKLLTKKLAGINESSLHISPAQKWVKQVLAVWTLQPTWVPTLQAAWQKLDADLRADTVILVVVEQGPGFIVPEACGAP